MEPGSWLGPEGMRRDCSQVCSDESVLELAEVVVGIANVLKTEQDSFKFLRQLIFFFF